MSSQGITMKLSTNYHSHHNYSSSWFLLLLLFVPYSSGLNSDGTLLLSFKYSLLADPLSVLENWDYNDANPCLWKGVSCTQIGNDPFRVISLALPDSNLLGSIPEDLGFIPHLKRLDLSANFLNGTLPGSLFNASELQILSLSSNAIYGGLPEAVGGLKSLKILNLSDNALAGEIPEELSGLQNLSVVSLRSNYFSGPVPGGFRFVQVLDLSSNLLNGTLPGEFGGENLKYLNLSSNRLSGLLPPEFAAKLPANTTVDLSFNNLTGEIPESTAMSNQKTEFFAGNVDLCGKPLKKLCTIPSSLSNPPNVSTNTSPPAIAAIPKSINSSPVPTSADAAAQNPPPHGLNPGAVAGIVVGDLAGLGLLGMVFLYVYQLKKKKKNADGTETSAQKFNKPPENSVKFNKSLEISVTVKETKSLPTWPCLTMTNGEETETSEATVSDSDDSKNENPGNREKTEHELVQNERSKKQSSFVMIDGETKLDLETLLKASAYILGSSGGSIVYKAVLEDGRGFAVRRIGECGMKKMKEFEHQVKAIAKLRHPNLIRVRGFYWGDDEKLVIYDYVSNGSLANVGFRKVGSSPYHLAFDVRVKIAKGLAKGIAFVHDKKQVHGNIKPSNVLLTPEMDPIISDFGLHCLLYGKTTNCKTDNSSRHFGSRRSTPYGLPEFPAAQTGSPYIAPAGFMSCTSPYHAPESLKDLKPSPKWDVYSFGIVLLELLTGKMFSERELSQWTASGSVAENKDRVLRMADVSIRVDVESREESTLALFKLGFDCASLDPKKRPSMKDALHVLQNIPLSSHL